MARTIRIVSRLVLFASLIAATGITGASAASGQLVIVPNSPEASAVIRSSGVRVIARYEEFTLVEAGVMDMRRLHAVNGEVRDDLRRVRIGQHVFDPTEPDFKGKSGETLRLAARGGNALAVVQYVGPLKREWIDAVRASGTEVVQSLGRNAQLVIGAPDAIASLGGLVDKGFVRAVMPYGAALKLRAGLAQSGETQVVITTAAGAAGDAARAEIARVSKPLGSLVPTGGTAHQRVQLDAGKVNELAELGGVVAIEPFVEPKLHDERSATIVAGRLNRFFQPLLGTGYRKYLIDHGFPAISNVIIDITDEGVDKGVVPVPTGSHPAFYRNGNVSAPSRIVYAQENTASDTDARDCGGHGTNVASIAAGYAIQPGAVHEDADRFNYGLGMHPFGKLGATKIFNCASGSFDVQTSITVLHSAAYGFGARISNNSWGAAVGGLYNSRSQEFDSLVRDAQPGVTGNQQFVEVVSAGNSGPGPSTIGSPGTAKNVITVGASESTRQIGGSDGCGVPDTGSDSARDIIFFSSRGPTSDGRIKPDVVAPGTHITGAQPQTGGDYNGSGTCNPVFPVGSTLYNLVSGTSQAAPHVTGFASLIHQWYKTNVPGHVTPSPAMTKAIMINTATDLAGGNDGNGGTLTHIPNNIQGWGRINLGNLLDGTTRKFIDQPAPLNTTGAAINRFFEIADPSKPLRVSLVWTDPPGPTSGNALVNDLDLEVTAGGATYKGNVFADGRSAVGGTADSKNNVENVFLPAGISGGARVRVIAKNIAGDGVPGNADLTDQDYALVVSNANPTTQAVVLEAGAPTVTPLGDNDAFLEKGEPFKLWLKLKNIGNAAAPAFSGTLTAPTGEATIQHGTANWPAIAKNATKQNTPAFTATVKSNLACGKPVHLAIAGNAGGSSFQIPLELQTGHPGAAVTFASTDVPKTIPDNNVAGVSSIRTLTGPGTINNLTVTIGSIAHTYDADLQIELTAPDGTTVQLFNRRGGSGDNLTNTVFSDAAATPISAGTAPFTGTFIPEQPLSAFNGKPAAGDWKLTVRDNASADTGTLQSWSLTRKLWICN